MNTPLNTLNGTSVKSVSSSVFQRIPVHAVSIPIGQGAGVPHGM